MAALDAVVREARVSCIEFFSATADRSDWRTVRWKNGNFGMLDRVRVKPDRLHGGLAAALKELREKNRNHLDVYYRPAQGQSEDSVIAYPYFFLDDVNRRKALEIGRRYRSLVIQTSKEGGCQIIVFTEQQIDRQSRGQAQQALAKLAGGDTGATSGIQPMRMAGTRNWKRGGCFVDVLKMPDRSLPLFDTLLIPQTPIWTPCGDKTSTASVAPRHSRAAGPVLSMGVLDEMIHSELSCTDDRSVADFRACLRLLRAGVDEDVLIDSLEGLSDRKGRHAHDYTVRTVLKAATKINDV